MPFVKHGGLGRTFPNQPHTPPLTTWTEDRLRSELQSRGVWTSSLPGNVECWYPQVLSYVKTGCFTFEEFADEFASEQPFDYGKTISRLLEPQPHFCGGWIEGLMD